MANTTTGLPKQSPTTDQYGRPTTLNTVLRAFRCPKDLSDWADQMARQGHRHSRYTWTMLCTLALHELRNSFAAEARLDSTPKKKPGTKQPKLIVSKSSTPGKRRTVQKQLPLEKGSK